jgi:hypothetical protein
MSAQTLVSDGGLIAARFMRVNLFLMLRLLCLHKHPPIPERSCKLPIHTVRLSLLIAALIARY